MRDAILLVLLALVATASCYALLRWRFPERSSPHRVDETLDVLHERFRFKPLEHMGWVVFFVILGGWLAYGLFWLGETALQSGRLAKSIHYIGPDRAARVLVALLGGGALALPLGAYWMKRRLGDAYSGYIDYQNRLTGLANERATMALGRLSLVAFLVLSAMFLQWYSAFGPAGLRQNPLFGLTVREYAYGDVDALQTLAAFQRPDGRICDLEHYRIIFQDGRRWDSRNSGFESPERNRALFQFLSDKIGMPLVAVGPDGEVLGSQ
jgi:hypothetical protein